MTKAKAIEIPPDTQPAQTIRLRQRLAVELKRIIATSLFAKLYMGAAVVILLATTFLWAYLSARVQGGNADQLIDAYLLQDGATFRGADFPGAHSFLVKWPLFLLIKLAGFSAGAFLWYTVGIVLLTVGALAFILYRIERRPLVFGTLCLALASVLLLVPAQPYPGALLPVNMAMLTTRNLEYVLFIFGLFLLVRSPKFKRPGFWLGVLCMGLLIASDKLFLTLAAGGALLATVAYALASKWKYVGMAVKWLVAGVAAAGVAAGLLWILNSAHLTHIVEGAAAGPYGFVHGGKQILLGVIYSFLGLLANFGTLSGVDFSILRNLPHQLWTGLWSASGVAMVINGFIMTAGIVAAAYLLLKSLGARKGQYERTDTSFRLSIFLIWTTIAMLVVFVATAHYYAVDARYLAISLFAVFIASATFARNRSWPAHRLVLAGIIITSGIGLGIPGALKVSYSEKAALDNVNARNSLIAQAVLHHPVDVVVGDYWRVVTAKQYLGDTQRVMPLQDCVTPRGILSSDQWRPDLREHSFAYLLSMDRSLTDYPSCNLAQVVAEYGRPNASVTLAGNIDHPQELLLFYDHGSHKSAPETPPPVAGTSTVVPIGLDQLPYTTCPVPTVMNVVAHQDDDLLFMNPDLLRDLKAGHCVRTVYMTAGDAGLDQFYWLSREQGSTAAYDTMLGLPKDTVWVRRIVKLPHGQYISVVNPRGSAVVSLIFMHLPDGGVRGGGFSTSHYENLARLKAGSIGRLHTVDNQSSYTASQLQDALISIMQTYHPAEVRTQSKQFGRYFHDHSDHMAVGAFTAQAHAEYVKQQFEGLVSIPLKFYLGYPTHESPENVGGTELQEKTAAFLEYAKYDGGVCHSVEQCRRDPAYGAYLPRQYEVSN
jgi:LmbE family N-acetylglucosaminyl deacetylase